MKVTANDIAQLLASAPPRRVPAQVAKAATGGSSAWFLPLFGLVFGGMGLMGTMVFFPWTFWNDWQLAADNARNTEGVVRQVTETNVSLNDVKVVEYFFTYIPTDGHRREGRCFTTGREWNLNAAVTVRYLGENPDVACIEGARLSAGGGFGAFVIIFPLVGGGMVAWFFVDRWRKRRLLHEGLVTEVDVLSVDETSMKVNYQNVYRIVVAGPALQAGRPVTVKRVNKADVNLALKHARDKQPIFILYDPRNHARVLFPEAMIDQ